jgi:hypothetical protein
MLSISAGSRSPSAQAACTMGRYAASRGSASAERRGSAKEAARSAKTAKDVETWKGDIAKETSTLVTN